MARSCENGRIKSELHARYFQQYEQSPVSGSDLSSLQTRDEENGSKRRREEDRPNYDDEERFAILYLRIVREEKWAEIMHHFNVLFPPGAPRRQADRGLSETYPRRGQGGLSCRYYRLRQDLNIPALRSVGQSSDQDKMAIVKLRSESNLSEEFCECLRRL